jgi:hypothetical protein
MTINTAAAYRGACARIRTLGWTQHQWTGSQGEECLMQALGRFTDLTQEGEDTVTQVPKAVLVPLIKELGLQPTAETRAGFAAALWDWNDQDGRTVEEVTALLQRIASQLDAESAPVYIPRWMSRHLFKSNSTEKKPALVG